MNLSDLIDWEKFFGLKEFTLGHEFEVEPNEVALMWHHFLAKSQ